MNRMIQLAAIALIAVSFATAAAKAEHGRVVHASASASPADVVVNQGPSSHHHCRGWRRFCFDRPW